MIVHEVPFVVDPITIETPVAEEPEFKALKADSNVQDRDQRGHMVLNDDAYMEVLSRCPRGLQKDVASVMLYLKGCKDEISRLNSMEKMQPDKRGNIRVLKDTTTYIQRWLKPCIKPGCAVWDEPNLKFELKPDCEHVPAEHPKPVKRTFMDLLMGRKKPEPVPLLEDHFILRQRTVGIYTVLPKVQVPLYKRKFEKQTAQGLDWAWRILRLWIGEDGKGRTENIDALQAANGRLLPAESGGMPVIYNMNGQAPGPGKGGFKR